MWIIPDCQYEFELFSDEKTRVFRVAELNFAIKQLLESNVPLLWVRGEISNLVKAASGHFYFSLKDDQAQVRCVMFRHKNQLLKEPIANGQQVEVLAVATLYEQRGDFQLTVEQMRPAGLGILYERFERLKAIAGKRRTVRRRAQACLAGLSRTASASSPRRRPPHCAMCSPP